MKPVSTCVVGGGFCASVVAVVVVAVALLGKVTNGMGCWASRIRRALR